METSLGFADMGFECPGAAVRGAAGARDCGCDFVRGDDRIGAVEGEHAGDVGGGVGIVD